MLEFDGIRGRTKKGGGNNYWNCLCRCGRIVSVATNHLRHAPNPKCRACAGEAQRTEWWSYRLIEHSYKFNAKERGYEWALTLEQVKELVTKPCHYCGAVGTKTLKDPRVEGRTLDYNGMDRYDNNRGYTPDNVVTCCWTCNNSKHARSGDEFIAWCKKIAARHGEI